MPLEGLAPPIKRRPINRSLPQPTPARLNEAAPPDTLDGGWDRRLRKGGVSPERTIDLHGHTLASAAGALEHALARAIADDIRVLLVITGKPPKPDTKGASCPLKSVVRQRAIYHRLTLILHILCQASGQYDSHQRNVTQQNSWHVY